MIYIEKSNQAPTQFSNYIYNEFNTPQIQMSQQQLLNMSPSLKKKLKQRKQLNKKVQCLQNKCEQFRVDTAKKSVQLTCFKQKLMLLLTKAEKYQKTLFKVTDLLKQSLNRFGYNVKEGPQLYYTQQEGINLQSYQLFISLQFRILNEEVDKSLKNQQILRHKRIKLQEMQHKIQKLENQSFILSNENQSILRLVQKTRQDNDKIRQDLSGKQKQLKRYQQEQRNYQQLTKDLDLKIKNRSDVQLLFKGLLKKHMQHQKKCNLCKRQHKISIKQLQAYGEERKSYFKNNKDQLENILNFQI